ncbi:MAG: response regulator [Chromatiales bacterium]|nr:response regulator [Chromatiales bacterium]
MEVLAAPADADEVVAAAARAAARPAWCWTCACPPTDGLALLRRMRAEGIDTPALILTMSDSEADLAAALRAGVRGYLLKDMEPEDVIAAIGNARARRAGGGAGDDAQAGAAAAGRRARAATARPARRR